MTCVPSENVQPSFSFTVHARLSSDVIELATSLTIEPSFLYATSPAKSWSTMRPPPVSVVAVGISGFAGSVPLARMIPLDSSPPPPHAERVRIVASRSAEAGRINFMVVSPDHVLSVPHAQSDCPVRCRLLDHKQFGSLLRFSRRSVARIGRKTRADLLPHARDAKEAGWP